MTAAFDSLEFESRWVGWRNEPRANDPTKFNKVPYTPHTGSKAKADDPSTWGSRSSADAESGICRTGGRVPLYGHHHLCISSVTRCELATDQDAAAAIYRDIT